MTWEQGILPGLEEYVEIDDGVFDDDYMPGIPPELDFEYCNAGNVYDICQYREHDPAVAVRCHCGGNWVCPICGYGWQSMCECITGGLT